jgi:predicted small lipoprotein YifL
MKNHTIFCLLTAAAVLSACGPKAPLYKDADRSAEERADDLLKRMTVEEKLGQLLCPLGWPMYDKVSADSVTISDAYRDFIQNQPGGMLWAVFRADPWTRKTLENGLDPTLAAKAYNALQRYAMDSTRLGIPIILAEEAPHGHMAIGTTVFPNAELKIFVTATAEVRAQRRYDELVSKGMPEPYEDILKNVLERDYIDTHREVSPLRQADDALLLDNSNMTIPEQNAWVMARYEEAVAE